LQRSSAITHCKLTFFAPDKIWTVCRLETWFAEEPEKINNKTIQNNLIHVLRTTTNHSNQEAAQSIYFLHEKKTSDQGLDVLVSLISLEQLCSAKKNLETSTK